MLTLQARLDKFIKEWISNPGAQMDFVKLVEAIHQQPSSDHADYELLEWIDEQRDHLRSIGISR